jgi:cytochrome c-type biogenesis protein CcmF
VPIGIFLLFLTGVGPLIAWRRSSLDSLRRNFMWPAAGALTLMVALVAAGVRHFYAILCFGMCLFVAWTIVTEFWKGSRAISGRTGKNLLMSAVELTHRNTRRYGGYVVHMGIVFMFIGFAGSAFNKDATNEVKMGDKFSVGRYEMRVKEIREGANENYTWQTANVAVYHDGEYIGELNPEQRLYGGRNPQPTHEVAIRRRLNEDLYLNFAGTNEGRAVIQAYVNPLVSWIWIGFWVLFFGTLVCLVPSKVKLQYARTEVVGIAQKHAKIQK